MGHEGNGNMTKIIYTDIDLTLLDFNAGFEDFLRNVVGMDVAEGQLDGHSHLPNAVEGITPDVAKSLVHRFFDDPMFGALPALKGAPEATQRLYEHGWRFVGISACPVGVGADIRKKNLELMLEVPFEAVHLSGYDGCKRSILESFDPCVWVEDNVNHAHVGHELGYKTYLIDQLHNRDSDVLVTRVKSWSEIADDLLCMAI
jgi:hypothetical protein